MIYYKNSSELYHHGILGQKWGVRRYQNADGTLTDAGKKRYTDVQRKRDTNVYGKSGARRIERNINEKGYSVSAARSEEASRINKTRKAAQVSGNVGKIAGSVGGAIGGYYASKYVVSALTKTVPEISEALNDPMVNMAVKAIVSAGASKLATQAGSDLARSATMAINGYSPDKYR